MEQSHLSSEPNFSSVCEPSESAPSLFNHAASASTRRAGSVWLTMLRDLERATDMAYEGVFNSSATASLLSQIATPSIPAFQPHPEQLDELQTEQLNDDVDWNIERVDTTTVFLSWQGATRGRYTDQRWKLTTATSNGRCLLSKAEIKRGDRVFCNNQSGASRFAPRAMILALTIDAICPTPSP